MEGPGKTKDLKFERLSRQKYGIRDIMIVCYHLRTRDRKNSPDAPGTEKGKVRRSFCGLYFEEKGEKTPALIRRYSHPTDTSPMVQRTTCPRYVPGRARDALELALKQRVGRRLNYDTDSIKKPGGRGGGRG